MNPNPTPHLSRLSSTEPDIDLSQWQRLGDYSGSSFSNVPIKEQRVECKKVPTSIGKRIIAGLGVTTILLLGTALWSHSHQSYQSSPMMEWH